MSNITSLSQFRASRIECERQRREEALAAEALAAVREAIGPEQLEQRAMEFSAKNAEMAKELNEQKQKADRLDGARKSALDHLVKRAPVVAGIFGLASLVAADLTVDLLPVTSLLPVAGVAALVWFARGIARQLEKSGPMPGLAQHSGALDGDLRR
ncbi:MAG: hypothetical protein ACT6RB_15555 [Neoaquamicrobium sediminum]